MLKAFRTALEIPDCCGECQFLKTAPMPLADGREKLFCGDEHNMNAFICVEGSVVHDMIQDNRVDSNCPYRKKDVPLDTTEGPHQVMGVGLI